jgi:phosphoglycerate dehydrogenase-like enzyme
VEALRQHRIGGAALDVFEKEPLPPESPLWKTANVLITPHSAALTEKVWERHYGLISDNLRCLLAGAPLRNLVDKTRGY